MATDAFPTIQNARSKYPDLFTGLTDIDALAKIKTLGKGGYDDLEYTPPKDAKPLLKNFRDKYTPQWAEENGINFGKDISEMSDPELLFKIQEYAPGSYDDFAYFAPKIGKYKQDATQLVNQMRQTRNDLKTKTDQEILTAIQNENPREYHDFELKSQSKFINDLVEGIPIVQRVIPAIAEGVSRGGPNALIGFGNMTEATGLDKVAEYVPDFLKHPLATAVFPPLALVSGKQIKESGEKLKSDWTVQQKLSADPVVSALQQFASGLTETAVDWYGMGKVSRVIGAVKRGEELLAAKKGFDWAQAASGGTYFGLKQAATAKQEAMQEGLSASKVGTHALAGFAAGTLEMVPLERAIGGARNLKATLLDTWKKERIATKPYLNFRDAVIELGSPASIRAQAVHSLLDESVQSVLSDVTFDFLVGRKIDSWGKWAGEKLTNGAMEGLGGLMMGGIQGHVNKKQVIRAINNWEHRPPVFDANGKEIEKEDGTVETRPLYPSEIPKFLALKQIMIDALTEWSPKYFEYYGKLTKESENETDGNAFINNFKKSIGGETFGLGAMKYVDAETMTTPEEAAQHGVPVGRKFADINYETGEVTLYKGGSMMDLYHELFHGIDHWGFLTREQRNYLKQEFTKEVNGEQVYDPELAAESFAEASKQTQPKTATDVLIKQANAVFSRVFNKAGFKKVNPENVFEDIYSGYQAQIFKERLNSDFKNPAADPVGNRVLNPLPRTEDPNNLGFAPETETGSPAGMQPLNPLPTTEAPANVRTETPAVIPPPREGAQIRTAAEGKALYEKSKQLQEARKKAAETPVPVEGRVQGVTRSTHVMTPDQLKIFDDARYKYEEQKISESNLKNQQLPDILDLSLPDIRMGPFNEEDYLKTQDPADKMKWYKDKADLDAFYINNEYGVPQRVSRLKKSSNAVLNELEAKYGKLPQKNVTKKRVYKKRVPKPKVVQDVQDAAKVFIGQDPIVEAEVQKKEREIAIEAVLVGTATGFNVKAISPTGMLNEEEASQLLLDLRVPPFKFEIKKLLNQNTKFPRSPNAKPIYDAHLVIKAYKENFIDKKEIKTESVPVKVIPSLEEQSNKKTDNLIPDKNLEKLKEALVGNSKKKKEKGPPVSQGTLPVSQGTLKEKGPPVSQGTFDLTTNESLEEQLAKFYLIQNRVLPEKSAKKWVDYLGKGGRTSASMMTESALWVMENHPSANKKLAQEYRYSLNKAKNLAQSYRVNLDSIAADDLLAMGTIRDLTGWWYNHVMGEWQVQIFDPLPEINYSILNPQSKSMRTRINDIGKLQDGKIPSYATWNGPLSELLKNPSFFKQFPDASNIHVEVNLGTAVKLPSTGFWTKEKNKGSFQNPSIKYPYGKITIHANQNIDDFLNTLFHEITHYQQLQGKVQSSHVRAVDFITSLKKDMTYLADASPKYLEGKFRDFIKEINSKFNSMEFEIYEGLFNEKEARMNAEHLGKEIPDIYAAYSDDFLNMREYNLPRELQDRYNALMKEFMSPKTVIPNKDMYLDSLNIEPNGRRGSRVVLASMAFDLSRSMSPNAAWDTYEQAAKDRGMEPDLDVFIKENKKADKTSASIMSESALIFVSDKAERERLQDNLRIAKMFIRNMLGHEIEKSDPKIFDDNDVLKELYCVYRATGWYYDNAAKMYLTQKLDPKLKVNYNKFEEFTREPSRANRPWYHHYFAGKLEEILPKDPIYDWHYHLKDVDVELTVNMNFNKPYSSSEGGGGHYETPFSRNLNGKIVVSAWSRYELETSLIHEILHHQQYKVGIPYVKKETDVNRIKDRLLKLKSQIDLKIKEYFDTLKDKFDQDEIDASAGIQVGRALDSELYDVIYSKEALHKIYKRFPHEIQSRLHAEGYSSSLGRGAFSIESANSIPEGEADFTKLSPYELTLKEFQHNEGGKLSELSYDVKIQDIEDKIFQYLTYPFGQAATSASMGSNRFWLSSTEVKNLKPSIHDKSRVVALNLGIVVPHPGPQPKAKRDRALGMIHRMFPSMDPAIWDEFAIRNDYFTSLREGVRHDEELEVLSQLVDQQKLVKRGERKPGFTANDAEVKSLGNSVANMNAEIKRLQALPQTFEIQAQIAQLIVDMRISGSIMVGAIGEAARVVRLSQFIQKQLVALAAPGGNTQSRELYRNILKASQNSGITITDITTDLARLSDKAKMRYIWELSQPKNNMDTFRKYTLWYIYNNLLSSPYTHARNLISTGATLTKEIALVRPLAIGLGKLMGNEGVSWKEMHPKILLAAAKTGWLEGTRAAIEIWKDGFTAEDMKNLDVPHTEVSGGIYTNFITRGLYGADMFLGAMMSNYVTSTMAATEAIQMSANETEFIQNFQRIRANPSDKIKEQASIIAKRAIYREPLSAGMNHVIGFRDWVDQHTVFGGRILFTFVSTSSNVIKRAAQTTPLGFVFENQIAFINKSHWKTASRSQLDDLANTVLGTVVLTAIAALMEIGALDLEGNAPTDPAKLEKFRMQRKAPNSFKFAGDDTWYSYQYLGDLGMAMSFVSSWVNTFKEEGLNPSSLAEGFLEVGKSLKSMSALSGLSTIMGALDDPNYKGPMVIKNVATMLTPAGSASNWATQVISDTPLKEPANTWERMAATSFLWDKALRPLGIKVEDIPSRYDYQGKDIGVEEITDLGFVRMRESPNDPVANELIKLKDNLKAVQAVDEESHKLSVQLTPTKSDLGLPDDLKTLRGPITKMELNQIGRAMTKNRYLAVKELIKSPEYKELDLVGKVQAVSQMQKKAVIEIHDRALESLRESGSIKNLSAPPQFF